MISAWQVYLVMQLDRIVLMFTLFAIACSLASIFLAVLASEAYGEDEIVLFRWMRGSIVLAILSVLLAVATPSSKTLAAMIVLPVITSDKVVDAVTPEAKELYGLAKDALRSLSVKKAEPAKAEPKAE